MCRTLTILWQSHSIDTTDNTNQDLASTGIWKGTEWAASCLPNKFPNLTTCHYLLFVRSHHVLTLWYPDHHQLALWLLHLPLYCFCQDTVLQQTLSQQCLLAAACQGLHFKHGQRWCLLPSCALAAAAWAQLHRWVARWQRQSAWPCLLTSHANCLGGPGCPWRASPACMIGTWIVHPPEQKGRSLSFAISSWDFRQQNQKQTKANYCVRLICPLL